MSTTTKQIEVLTILADKLVDIREYLANENQKGLIRADYTNSLFRSDCLPHLEAFKLIDCVIKDVNYTIRRTKEGRAIDTVI